MEPRGASRAEPDAALFTAPAARFPPLSPDSARSETRGAGSLQNLWTKWILKMRSGRKDTQQGRGASAAVEGGQGTLCGGRWVPGSGAPCTSLSPTWRVLCSSGAAQVEDGAKN